METVTAKEGNVTSTTDTGKDPITKIRSIYDMRWTFSTIDSGMHGYCTVQPTLGRESDHAFDVWAEVDGDEVMIGRSVTSTKAVELVNRANRDLNLGAIDLDTYTV